MGNRIKGVNYMPQIDVTPIISNTTMKAYYNNQNELVSYLIFPIEGYVLHNKNLDYEVFDELTGEFTGEIKQGFVPYPSFSAVGSNYDWEANPFEFFTVLANTVPADQIFRVDDEIM